MRVRLLAAMIGICVVFGAAMASAMQAAANPPVPPEAAGKPAGQTAPETVPLMTPGRKHAIVAGIVAAAFLMMAGAAARTDKSGAGERIGPRSSRRRPPGPPSVPRR